MSSLKKIDIQGLEQLIDQKLQEQAQYQVADRPLLKAAALNATFDQKKLLAFASAREMPYSERDIQWLQHYAVAAERDRWALAESARIQLLREMQKQQPLSSLQEQYQLPDADTLADRLFAALLRGEMGRTAMEKLSIREVHALLRPLRWLEEAGLNAEDRWYCEYRLEKHQLLEQFRRHTEHFKGRKDELEELKEFVFTPNDTSRLKAPLLLYGIGGIGKSSLISKFLLDHFASENDSRLPFVYLDFDRAGLSIAEPLRLAIEALRQLLLQYPAAPGEKDPLRDAREDLISFVERGKDQPGSSPASKGASRGDTREFIIKNIAGRYLKALPAGAGEKPVTVVFDSFEEVQYRSSKAELRDLLSFLNEIGKYLPNLRLIIVGRSDLLIAPIEFTKLGLEDFDTVAANEYLKALGVEDSDVRKLIFTRIGGNPLNLKLAAALASQGAEDLEELKEQLSETQIREQLIRRNIDHIPDEATRKLVIPGMLVRRITPELVEKVLAPVSKLGPISSADAAHIYGILERLTFLTAFRQGHLAFRPDLRKALQGLIQADERELVNRLHQKAIEYYEGRPELEAQAEYIFHRLQLEGPGFLEEGAYDYGALRPFLKNAIQELPANAASALARMYDLQIAESDKEALSEEEWERNMATEISKGLEQKMTEEELRMLWQRVKEKPGSIPEYQYYRAVLAIRSGLNQEARQAISAATSTISLPDRAFLLLQLGNYSEDPGANEEAVRLMSQIEGAVPERPRLSVVLAALLLAKWAGLYDQRNSESPPEALGALITSFKHLPEGREGEVSPLLRPPLRFENTSAARWRPLTTIQPYVLKSAGSARGLSGYDLQEPLLEAYWSAAEDYEMAGVSGAYRRLTEHLRKMGLKEANGRLFRIYKKLVSDVSEPGVWEVVVHDIADFLLAWHEGSLEAAGKAFDINLSDTSEEPGYPEGPVRRGLGPTPGEAGNEDMETFKKSLKLKISRGEIEKVLEELENAGEEQFRNSIILLSGRYRRMQREQRMGLVSDSDAQLERNRILASLLGYIDELE